MKFKNFLLFNFLYFLALNVKAQIIQLTPLQTANKLEELIANGLINKETLVVWDIDDTLFKSGSDIENPVIPICPSFTNIIRESQSNGVTHIALTNASPFHTELEFQESSLRIKNITPLQINPQQPSSNSNIIPTTFEELRIQGLEKIGIQFNKPEFLSIPRILLFMEASYRPNNKINILKKQIRNYGKIVAVEENSLTQQPNLYVTIDIKKSSPLLRANGYRHFLLTKKLIKEAICAPVFSKGIIFCNFVNFFTQYYYGTIKGDILSIFLDLYQQKTCQTFFNVVFIDDSLECVKSVNLAMKKIEKPCLAINIIRQSKFEDSSSIW